ncbi:MAG: DUF2141 domain-containing protein [Chitinophagaceae bacterium]|nr:DUF2141 domain-containing protein [Chitinophagaceae bacterium]
MKYILLFLVQMIVFSGWAQNSELKVTVSNINKIEGDLVVAVYNSAQTFIKEGKEFRRMARKIAAASETFSFTGLPSGEYSIALFHDKNSDGKCNTNFVGMPKEGYGFSRNFKPRFSAPKFNDTRVAITSDTVIQIRLIN